MGENKQADIQRRRSRALTVLTGLLGGGGNAVSYLLRDLFTTDVAAGSVNNTLSEPSGHTRAVTDTNSKLSLTGGVASVATGGAAAGDPGLWYAAQTRAAGLVLLGSLVSFNNGFEFGWDTAQAGSIAFGIRFLNASGILAIRDNVTAITIGGQPALVAYQMAIVLRATGCWYFIKGSGFTNWTLLWVSSTSSANLFPGFAIALTGDVFTVDNIRIPANLYLPSPLAYDTFTRANGALGSSENNSPDGVSVTARVWNFTTGIWAVATNKAVGTPVLGADVIVNGAFAADTDWTKGTNWTIAAGVATAAAASANLTAAVAPLTVGRWYQTAYTLSAFAAGTVQAVVGGISYPTHAANATYTETGRATSTAFLFTGAGFTGSLDNASSKLLVTAELFASVVTSTADVIAETAVTISAALGGLQAGLVLNLDSASNPQNFILAYLDGRGNCILTECVAGVYTDKFTTAVTYSAGAILRVIRDGTSCRVFYNNAAVSTVQTMSSNLNLSHGVFSTSASNSLDNFLCWPRGSSGEYSTLDSY